MPKKCAVRKPVITIRKWVNALRSGKYKQGKAVLKFTHSTGSKSFCCLGVLEDLCIRKGLRPSRSRTFLHGTGWTGKLGLNRKVQGELTEMNDIDGKSFKQIATFIEKHTKNGKLVRPW